MMKFDNYYAGDLMYQDFGDCSLCCLPIVRELEVKLETKISNKNKEPEKAA